MTHFDATCTVCHHDWDLIEIDLAADTVEDYIAARDLCPACGSTAIVWN